MQTAKQTSWARQAAKNPEAIELSTQITHTAVADDPAPLQAILASDIDVDPKEQDESTIFLTGTPAQARERLQRRREATGLSYFVVFDLSCNYARGSGSVPTLPGDSGPGAADRYIEAFSEWVVRPLIGQ